MSINNWFPLEAPPPPKPHHQCSLLYHELCKVWLSLYNYSWNLLWTCPVMLLLIYWVLRWLAASFMRSCWLWPAARTRGHDSSCTAPRRHRACPASVQREWEKKYIIWVLMPHQFSSNSNQASWSRVFIYFYHYQIMLNQEASCFHTYRTHGVL